MLAMILRDDPRIVGDAIERADRRWRNSTGRGLPLEAREPSVEPRRIAAGRGFNGRKPQEATNQTQKAYSRSHENDSSGNARATIPRDDACARVRAALARGTRVPAPNFVQGGHGPIVSMGDFVFEQDT